MRPVIDDRSTAGDSTSARAPGFLFEAGGELLTAVLIEHPPGAPPATATLRWPGGERRFAGTELAFRPGLARAGMPAAEVARSVEVTLELADGTTATQPVTVPPLRRQVAHLVHLAHQDPGWADRPRTLRDRMIPFLDEAVALADATAGYPDDARFRWNVECAYLIDDYAAARPAEAVERLAEAIRAGSIEVSALYAGVQSEFAGAEQLFRSADAALRLARQHGFRLRSAFLDDVPGFAWTLPTALAAAGVEHLVWGPDPIRSLAHHNREALYRLTGPDGRRGVLVWQAPYAYIEAWNLVELAEGDRERAVEGLMQRYADPAAYPHSSSCGWSRTTSTGPPATSPTSSATGTSAGRSRASGSRPRPTSSTPPSPPARRFRRAAGRIPMPGPTARRPSPGTRRASATRTGGFRSARRWRR